MHFQERRGVGMKGNDERLLGSEGLGFGVLRFGVGVLRFGVGVLRFGVGVLRFGVGKFLGPTLLFTKKYGTAVNTRSVKH
jgi:hypothetical protein